MLKIFAFILLLPLTAMSSNDCQLSSLGNTTSVECADLILTKQLSPSIDEVHLEFTDGFTLFFQADQNQQPEEFVVALGDREDAIISKKDHLQITEAMQLMAKSENTDSQTHAFLQGLPKDKPLNEVIQFGGEVPWPIVGCNSQEAAKTKACKEKK